MCVIYAECQKQPLLLCVVVLNDIMLSVPHKTFWLSVVMLSVIMLSVVAMYTTPKKVL
jgi:hypothetical protein